MKRKQPRGLRFTQIVTQHANTNLFGLPGDPNIFGLDAKGRVWRLIQLRNGSEGWAMLTSRIILADELEKDQATRRTSLSSSGPIQKQAQPPSTKPPYLRLVQGKKRIP